MKKEHTYVKNGKTAIWSRELDKRENTGEEVIVSYTDIEQLANIQSVFTEENIRTKSELQLFHDIVHNVVMAHIKELKPEIVSEWKRVLEAKKPTAQPDNTTNEIKFGVDDFLALDDAYKKYNCSNLSELAGILKMKNFTSDILKSLMPQYEQYLKAKESPKPKVEAKVIDYNEIMKSLRMNI